VSIGAGYHAPCVLRPPSWQDLDQPGTRDEIEQAWDEEIRARVKAVDEGRANGIPYEQIKNEMVGRFPPR
jgi:putative addiction module component (TIGR02574 family)